MILLTRVFSGLTRWNYGLKLGDLTSMILRLLLPCIFSGCSSALWKFTKGGWQLSLQQICVRSQIPRRLKG